MTLLRAGSVPARNSVFPERSSCAGSHPDVCVFLYRATETSRRLWTNQHRPEAGRVWTVVDMENGQFNTHTHHSCPDGETCPFAR